MTSIKVLLIIHFVPQQRALVASLHSAGINGSQLWPGSTAVFEPLSCYLGTLLAMCRQKWRQYQQQVLQWCDPLLHAARMFAASECCLAPHPGLSANDQRSKLISGNLLAIFRLLHVHPERPKTKSRSACRTGVKGLLAPP